MKDIYHHPVHYVVNMFASRSWFACDRNLIIKVTIITYDCAKFV